MGKGRSKEPEFIERQTAAQNAKKALLERFRAKVADPAAGERLQLIGVRPLERGATLRNGQQLVEPGSPAASLGYITSSTPSTELPGWVGLALLQGGRARIGEQLEALSPIHAERVAVRIVEPCLLDAESARVRA